LLMGDKVAGAADASNKPRMPASKNKVSALRAHPHPPAAVETHSQGTASPRGRRMPMCCSCSTSREVRHSCCCSTSRQRCPQRRTTRTH
jgi:hypothetical protein